MKNKKLLALSLAAALLLASCGNNAVNEAEEMEPSINLEEMEPPTEVQDEEVEPEEEQVKAEDETPETYGEAYLKSLEELTENEYPELTIEAVILERMAILPGHPVKVRISLNNTGEKTVDYVMGSGVAVVPQALYLHSDDLQTVMSKENYGPMTMDFRMASLEPGETTEFDYVLYTIEPTINFDEIAMELMQEEIYIGETPLDALAEKELELTPVEPGSYHAEAYFTYSVVDPEGEQDVLGNPTGFTKAPITFTVSD